MATAVGVSVGRREGSVGGISVGGASGVAVETNGGVGACGVQEEKRKRKRKDTCTACDLLSKSCRWERMRVVMRGGMESILTELYENDLSRINEKTFP